MRILSGFPGTGKSTFTKSHPLTVDLDSALFPKGENFVSDYIEAIENYLEKENLCVFVSTHPALLEGLREKSHDVILVYPSYTLKEEYLARYEGRGDWEAFLEQLDKNWLDYLKGLNEIQLTEGSKKVVLQRYETISDVIGFDVENGFFIK